MTDQKTTISLAQWCAYLPYGLMVDNDSLIEPRFELNPRNFTYVLSFPERVKPLLRPMNEANKANINEIMQTKLNTVYRFYPNYGFSDISDTSDEFYFTYDCLPYNIVQALRAAHYDLDGLIPQGLALPIE